MSLERTKKLQQCYAVSTQEIVTALPELVREKALLWLRNNRLPWSSWKDFDESFKFQYLPFSYNLSIEESIGDC